MRLSGGLWGRIGQQVSRCLVLSALFLGLWGCTADRAAPIVSPRSDRASGTVATQGLIREASPPATLQVLREMLAFHRPQVSLLNLQPDEVLNDNQVDLAFQVQDLPIFLNAKLGMGPHLEVFLDDRIRTMIYDLTEPLHLNDLEPGTHTLRFFAAYPWHESFKNEGAYGQVTFHVLTRTATNSPDPQLPLLTYSSPSGSYGAEPLLLDFYLTNAPLQGLVEESAAENFSQWRIRCTVNGESFILQRWESLYLQGFLPGKNWVKLEFLDDRGNPLLNTFNTTARLVDYTPGGQDIFSRLLRDELPLEIALGMVDPNYQIPLPTFTVTPSSIPSSTPLPDLTPLSTLTPTPSAFPQAPAEESDRLPITPVIPTTGAGKLPEPADPISPILPTVSPMPLETLETLETKALPQVPTSTTVTISPVPALLKTPEALIPRVVVTPTIAATPTQAPTSGAAQTPTSMPTRTAILQATPAIAPVPTAAANSSATPTPRAKQPSVRREEVGAKRSIVPSSTSQPVLSGTPKVSSSPANITPHPPILSETPSPTVQSQRQWPNFKMPKVELPEVKLPNMEDIHLPEVKPPSIKLPKVKLPNWLNQSQSQSQGQLQQPVRQPSPEQTAPKSESIEIGF